MQRRQIKENMKPAECNGQFVPGLRSLAFSLELEPWNNLFGDLNRDLNICAHVTDNRCPLLTGFIVGVLEKR